MAKIMIVEDSPHQQEFLTAVLRGDGHNIVAVNNGTEALERLNGETFDLILTDIFMPDCDGLELIRRIRATDTGMPIVAMSAGLQRDLFLRVAEVFGADAVLNKEQDPAQIAAIVAGVLAVQNIGHRAHGEAG